jgi:DNA-binding transcriptional LysR family regulator
VNGSTATWTEVSEMPLCLLTPDTQNRQIVDGLMRGVGGNPRVTLESDSLTVLLAHVRSGEWLTVIPERVAEASNLGQEFHMVPIVEPDVVHTIGLIMPVREPNTPLAAAFASEARRAAVALL